MSKTLRRLFLWALLCVGASSAVLAAPGVTRLYEIGVTRFVERPGGEMWAERGLLNALGTFRKTEESPVLSIVTVPAEARNKRLITLEAWFAYMRLGPEAVLNFVVDEDVNYAIGARFYLEVAPHPDPKLDDGVLINLSTRGRASSTEKLIGGFVIDQQHRRVLIRAVGPGLAAMGVADAMADPFVTIYHGNVPFYFNGDWHKRFDADEIAAAATKVGAFPLRAGSKDAALLVELPPGNYTAQLEPESGAPGTALLEIYSVP